MMVYVEKKGPVTIVILSRPEVRNAVDRNAAKELADAFRLKSLINISTNSIHKPPALPVRI